MSYNLVNFKKGEVMLKKMSIVGTVFSIALFITGCGGGGGSSSSSIASNNTGLFVDSRVSGLEYSAISKSGITDSNGYFTYRSGEEVTFKIGNIILGKAKLDDSNGGVITPANIVVDNTSKVEILRILQSLDNDGNPTNGISITNAKRLELKNAQKVDLSQSHLVLSDNEIKSLIKLNPNKHLVTQTEAENHLLQHNLI